MMVSHDIQTLKALHEARLRRLSSRWSDDRFARPRRAPKDAKNGTDH